jgi:hypothetical protein
MASARIQIVSFVVVESHVQGPLMGHPGIVHGARIPEKFCSAKTGKSADADVCVVKSIPRASEPNSCCRVLMAGASF